MSAVIPKVPPQYDPKISETARNRDITLQWLEGIGAVAVGRQWGLDADQVLEIVNAPAQKKLRDEIRQRAIDSALERFDVASVKALEVLVNLRDTSEDDKVKIQAIKELLTYSTLSKKTEDQGNIGADLIRGIAKLAKEQMDEKK